MHLASRLPTISAALLAALLPLACASKDPGDTTDGSSDAGSSGAGSSGAGSSGADASSAGTTLTPECTPGDAEGIEDGGCQACWCTNEGVWDCSFRCAPTTSDATTTDTASGTSVADTLDTTGATDGDPDTTSATDGDPDTTTGASAGLPSCADFPQSDEFQTDAAKVEGDALVLEVGYGGGCEDHEFTLCFGGLVRDGVVALAVVHDAHGDACEAFLSEELSFDLTPTQPLGASPLTIDLLGWDQPLEYAY